MISNGTYIVKKSQDALKNSVTEQEERKRTLLRQQHNRDLKQLEAKLYYKQQEVNKIKVHVDQLKRQLNLTLNKSTTGHTKQETTSKIRQIQSHIVEVEKSLQTKLDLISKKLAQNETLLETKEGEIQTCTQKKQTEQLHTQNSEIAMRENKLKEIESKILSLKHETDTLTQEQNTLAIEKQKITSELQQQKRGLIQTLNNASFEQQKEKNAKAQKEKEIATNQKVITGLEQSIRMFGQEISVLENKIKVLKTMMR